MSKILWLGPERPFLTNWLEDDGHIVFRTEEPLLPEYPILEEVDWLISYGYRHIVRPEILQLFPNRILNLHISYLPWNRGADPNLWSFLEDTPKGVTIHLMDEGLDTGPIFAQKEIQFEAGHSLASSYDVLNQEMEKLFVETWPLIVTQQVHPIPQVGKGSQHRVKDKTPLMHLLHSGWATPVDELASAFRQISRIPV